MEYNSALSLFWGICDNMSYFEKTWLMNILGNLINPATEDKQDDIIALFPQDALESMPIFIGHKQAAARAGNFYKAIDAQSIGAATVKYAVTSTTKYLHFSFNCSVFNGSVRIDLYKSATFTGGTAMTAYNRKLDSTNTATAVATSGVTSTDGTLIDSIYVGVTNKSSGSDTIDHEWILAKNSIYRVDVVGLVAGTEAVITFDWNE